MTDLSQTGPQVLEKTIAQRCTYISTITPAWRPSAGQDPATADPNDSAMSHSVKADKIQIPEEL